MQSASTNFTKFPMVLVTKAGNISLINWCLDQPSHIDSTPIASTMHFQLLKEGNDFLLYKVLDLPRMPIEKGHSYGKVLQNQKKLSWKKGLGMPFSYMLGAHLQGSCLPSYINKPLLQLLRVMVVYMFL
jgi:hypothetical protein